MNDLSDICLAIMAAGQSRRFGGTDKLSANLRGKMLGHHISDKLASFPFGQALIITSAHDHPCAKGWQDTGFELAVNRHALKGLGTSVALAAQIASESQSQGLLICLADMPFIPTRHFEKMLNLFASHEKEGVIASHDGEKPSPPAVFSPEYFDDLIQLNGDTGARTLLKNAVSIKLDACFLADIDHPEKLDQFNSDSPCSST